ncbi:serine dehydratase-like [Thamnophis elegans]|uniref:serine dehydratase-like n=1 Tax=Thamnophis elegans TaxID=35005 RepID=UPI0013777A1B|nr:serine dehydratase-like [Thamnophis elegans]XP_032094453.1 serine dehydratase-like [Thamnophis elegans]
METLPDVGFERPFHIETPLLESVALSQTSGTKVYMKLENVQPSGSFKIRGIGYFCQQMAKKGCRHLVCSSGGNAGLAAAYAARELRMPATIVVPCGTTESTIKRLEQYRANVEIFGKVKIGKLKCSRIQERLWLPRLRSGDELQRLTEKPFPFHSKVELACFPGWSLW